MQLVQQPIFIVCDCCGGYGIRLDSGFFNFRFPDFHPDILDCDVCGGFVLFNLATFAVLLISRPMLWVRRTTNEH